MQIAAQSLPSGAALFHRTSPNQIVMKSERRDLVWFWETLYDPPSAHQFEIDSPARPHDRGSH